MYSVFDKFSSNLFPTFFPGEKKSLSNQALDERQTYETSKGVVIIPKHRISPI